ncbi:MAG: GGDEF domain-containing protein, partial [Pseudomonadota bacterium]|nr:GGDEF domain-containing protein [Pseudomonadota bacterium]
HTDAACSAAQESLELARMQGDRYGQIEALMLLAQIQAGSLAGSEHSRVENESDALHYLQQALAVAAQIDSYIVPGEIYDALAEQYAGRGQWQLAYDSSLRAKESREKSTGKKAVDRALAMQIRYESERARAEGEHQRNLAEAEAERAEALQKITDTLNRLSAIGQEITAQLDAAAIFRTLEKHVNGLLDATHLSIYLIDEDNASLDCMFGIDAGKPMARRSVPRTSTTSHVARCARERCEIIIKRESTVVDNPAHIPGTVPSLSALFVPLEIGERVLGVMSIQSPHAAAYGERELLIFRSLCAYGAIGLDNANAYRQLNANLGQLADAQQKLQDRNRQLEDAYQTQERASLHDPLTGLHNRRFLTQHIEAEVAFALRANQHRNPHEWDESQENTDLVFFMIDVDHFKHVNDAWGHGAGDLVLQELARRLKSVARTSDFVIRWGGEEFLVVARATNRGDAQRISERLRQAVLEQSFDIGQPEPLVKTCSIGFASFPFVPGQADALSWSEVVEVADQALYAAKRGGRNTWVGYYGTAKTDRSRLRAHLGSNLAELEPTGELRICHPRPNNDPKLAIG